MRQPVLRQLYRDEKYKHYITLEEGLETAKTNEEKLEVIEKFKALSKEE